MYEHISYVFVSAGIAKCVDKRVGNKYIYGVEGSFIVPQLTYMYV